MESLVRKRPEDYSVGWLCALAKSELIAAYTMFDNHHQNPPRNNPHDENTYYCGDIHGHNIVLVCLPLCEPGKVSAMIMVQHMIQSFPALKLHLFVGVGGGVPRNPQPKNAEDDIHLGDVVLGVGEKSGVPGVVEYDFRRFRPKSEHELMSLPTHTNRRLLSALSSVLMHCGLGNDNFSDHLERFNTDRLSQFAHPGLEDTLFYATYDHPKPYETPCDGKCNSNEIVGRPKRTTQKPVFHQGTILSGDSLMTCARQRDELSQAHHDAIAFDMEAAGVMKYTNALVIRGISDYSDSHKNTSWQKYASATAAAFARELLHHLDPIEVQAQDHGYNGEH